MPTEFVDYVLAKHVHAISSSVGGCRNVGCEHAHDHGPTEDCKKIQPLLLNVNKVHIFLGPAGSGQQDESIQRAAANQLVDSPPVSKAFANLGKHVETLGLGFEGIAFITHVSDASSCRRNSSDIQPLLSGEPTGSMQDLQPPLATAAVRSASFLTAQPRKKV